MKMRIYSLIAKEFPFFLVMPALIWQVLFFYVPLLWIVYLSITHVGAPFFNFTLAHYTGLFEAAFFKIIARSLFLAFVNAVICLLIAYPIAYFAARSPRNWRNFFLFLLILPFWTSFVVHVYAWFYVLDTNGLINSTLLKIGLIKEPLAMVNTLFAVFLVMIYCYLPFMVMPLYSALEKFNWTLLEASMDLGATPAKTFFKITVPMTLPSIKTGFFLVFVPSFGEFVIPALLGGSKKMYVGSLIYHYFLVARDAVTGAAFTCLSSLILVAACLIIAWGFRKIFAGSGGVAQ